MSLARGSETETHGKGTGELRQRAVASLTSTHILSHRNTHTHTEEAFLPVGQEILQTLQIRKDTHGHSESEIKNILSINKPFV